MGILEGVTQDGDGQARGFDVQGNQRVKGLEFYAQREFGVLEFNTRERISTGKRGTVQAGQARDVLRPQAGASFEGGRKLRFQDPSQRLLAFRLCPNGSKGVIGRVSLIGPIENLPVTQLPAAAEGDRTRPDAAQREGNHLQMGSREHARVIDAGS